MLNPQERPTRRDLHDLKQPLNVILLACGTMRLRLEQLGDASLTEKLERIESQAKKAGGMIDGLLTKMPKPELGGQS
jgi:K+-sensing histidine kinase KdpD